MGKEKKQELDKGLGIRSRRAIAYIVLIFMTILCLFWFYVLFINATRSNSDLTKGFSPIPSSSLLTNWKNLLAGTLPVWSGSPSAVKPEAR